MTKGLNPASDPAPLTWALLGPKAGDNNQVRALAEKLGWSCIDKHLRFHWYELAANRLLRTTLAGLDRGHSDALQAPWPDLILTAGRRNEPVARWIKAQTGNQAKIVHIGRPWMPLDSYDLIVTTPQYSLPTAGNVLTLPLPLHRVTGERLNEAALLWAPRLAHLPRPWTAVLVGGDSGPYVFTAGKGRRLGEMLNQRQKSNGGSLLVTDSARTPPAACAALLSALQTPAYVYRWQEQDGNDNPYLGFLALADELVVTGESMSMLAEACATGKPVSIFDPADDPSKPWWRYAHNFRQKPLSHRLAMHFAPVRMRRDVGEIQQQLVGSGRAVWLDQAAAQQTEMCQPDPAAFAAERVRVLFAV